jgi:lipoprotein-releasing system permease protein
MGFFESFVALRYLKGVKRAKGFISLSTFISVAGITVGVMALIVVIGVMTGFDQDLKKKILSVNAHVILQQQGGNLGNYRTVAARVQGVPGVLEAVPYIYTQVMFSTPGNISGGVMRGLSPESIRQGGPKGLEVLGGSFPDLAETLAGAPPRIAIGKELARNLGLAVGDYLNIISPLGALTPMGRMPRMKAFRVTVIFHSGMFESDNSLVYAPIPALQEFLGMGDRVTGIEVEVKDIYAADRVAALLKQQLGPNFTTRDWMEMNRSLFTALKLEKIAMFIILTLIILVAAFGIASTLFMMVMKKTKDIAILKSMGATRQSIMQIFILKGLVIGVLGTSLGGALGLLLCGLLKRYEIVKLPRDVFYISTLPVQVHGPDLAMIIIAALAISFLATLYPSWQAARLDPVEAIRYE